MADELNITRSSTTPTSFRGKHAYQMEVTSVSTIVNLGSKILVKHFGAGIDGSDIFSCVASLPQMQELPEDAPGAEGSDGYPFYLVDSVTFVGYTLEELDTLWDKIVEDAQDLIDNFRLQGDYESAFTATLS